MDYLLDSNIILIYSRNGEISRKIEEKYQIFNGENRLAISNISLGEIDATIKKLNLGEKRKSIILNLLDNLNEFGISFQEVISKYGDIDAYSQGKLGKVDFTARNMGKNDIWIAATASFFNLTLITTDKDFNHLKGKFLDLEYISLEKIKNNYE